MKSDFVFFAEFIISFLPFVLFAFLNSKINVKKENRNRQYAMPVVALLYSVVLFIFLDKLARFCTDAFLKIANLFEKINLSVIGEFIRSLYLSWGIFLMLVLFNTAALLLFISIKRILTLVFGKISLRRNSFVGQLVEVFYMYDEADDCWYIKEHYGQARTFIKIVYYSSCFISGLALLVSCFLCKKNLISAPFYPVFSIIIVGELAFFVDGQSKDEKKSNLAVQADNSKRMAMYPLLRKPLKTLFGDKLSAEGTTVNNGEIAGGAIEDVLVELEKNGGHIGGNYSGFIRKKMETGLKPNVDYVRCGYDLATGKSLLFNTPFYDKLNPYVFYAINRELLTGGKVLIVLGRHGTEDDLKEWCRTGMKSVSNIPDLWKISVLSNRKVNDESMPDIAIVSRSGVHDLGIHKNNLSFLKKVTFVMIVEPSKLVTTAQIGLNLLIKCCGKECSITFCSVDRNCDGLVDALSHILMTSITEVSATEYPLGVNSYMCWTADGDYLQHRILPGVSRYLGMGTELSAVALKNQVKKIVWYGEDAFPVQDARWIAKQYYYELLNYAQLPTNQETFDKCFKTSFNMCNERVDDYSFITVEDDRNNLFETRRNFATIAQQQGFVNVISADYMLREYMAANMEVFTADAKAIPYITADYARTKRNAILSLCLLLCIDSVPEEVLLRQMIMLNIETNDPVSEIWNEICVIFGQKMDLDAQNNKVLSVENRDGKTICFERDSTIVSKRAYDIESGKFQNVYTIESSDFSRIILDDLQNASYIAEQENKDAYIGTELKGHIYQKYLPGQFFTLNGKYYEMVSSATDNRILVRRASEHIGGRLTYRQVRKYKINKLEDCSLMGSLKTVNDIDIHYQFADFSVETSGYWKMNSRNDFDKGDLVMVNGVPRREYHHKQLLKFDFSKLGDAFTESVRMTLTNLLNEVFVTLFADNQPFISAVTLGDYEAPLTYSLDVEENVCAAEKCIFIIEDSQLDIGLLIAVERNVNRIFQIISDYLTWNDEQIAESLSKENLPQEEKKNSADTFSEETTLPKKEGIFTRVCNWVKSLFRKKTRGNVDETNEEEPNLEELKTKDKKKAERAAEKAARKAAREQKKIQKKDEKLRKKSKTEDGIIEQEAADIEEISEVDKIESVETSGNEESQEPESEKIITEDVAKEDVITEADGTEVDEHE